MKARKTVQKFSKANVENSRKLTPLQIVQFLDQYQMLHAMKDGPRKLISIRIPENLLKHFKAKAELDGQKYQTLIVQLMRDYVFGNEPAE